MEVVIIIFILLLFGYQVSINDSNLRVLKENGKISEKEIEIQERENNNIKVFIKLFSIGILIVLVIAGLYYLFSMSQRNQRNYKTEMLTCIKS
jgi:uncharacterized membrane protein